MNIQDLKSNTTWQEASNTINNNNNKISLAIATLENATLKNKGYFTTKEKLKAAIPNPTIGSKAYVGTSEPYAIYIVENGAWVDSGYTGGDEIVANITTDRIEDGAVTSEKIATSAFDSTLSVSGKIAPADVVGEKLNELDKQVIYDITANNNGETFASLSALLSSENLSTLIPYAVRCGGMSIRFVQSSDNKYVQFRLMTKAFTTDVTQWQGVDKEPTDGSKNIVESGGVFIDIKNTALINASEITNTELPLADTLPLIPTKYRKGLAFLSVREGITNNLHLYCFISRDPTEQNWNNVANWRKMVREDEVNTLITNAVNAEKTRAENAESGLALDIKNTALINICEITNQEPQTLADAIALVPAKFRKGLAFITFRVNGVVQLYNFISLTPNEQNWNNTAYWVKWVNEDQVNQADAILATDISNTSLINASEITNTELSLAETLPLVPDKYRKGLAFLSVREGITNNLHLYCFISRDPTEQNWNNVANWRKMVREDEINAVLTSLNSRVSNCEDSIPAGKTFNNGDYHYYAYFNGQDSVIRFNAIAFKQDGDYLEIEFKNVGGGTIWSTVQRDNLENIFLGVNPKSLGVRGVGDTWIYRNDENLDEKTSFTFKMLYQDGNILIYRDSELLSTYTGQIDTYMCGFGKNSVWDYWKGGIGLIKINSATSGIQNWEGYAYQLPNITQDNTTYRADNGFLTDEQAAILNNIDTLPTMVVSYRNAYGVFYVYMRKPGTNIYFMLDLHHVINNDELVYLDIWRLSGDGQLCKYENGQFINLNKNLLLGVENEFAMQFSGAADFTGGYHGDERIDTDGSFCKFFVDGKELTPTQLSEDFTVECSNFYMLSNATLHETTTDGQTPVAGHPIIARHIKKTIFCDCGFTCENRVDFLANKEVRVLFTGLVCVHKDCALSAYADDYIIRDVSTGAEVSINIDDSCKGKVCFYNNNTGLSCIVDSHAVGENDDNLYIRLQDRANDSKYYRYATNDGVRTVTTGDKYLCKVKAKWDYNIN